ncbi:MAG: ISNCY family transposase, partial [Alphaproteobacteria bacterium]|nr:ISNCY family transposase [Alphaproteobacteria bacterium]
MRKLREDQMNVNLFEISCGADKISQEFVQMSTIPDACGTELIDLVAADLGMNENEKTGRQGMSAESAMRCAILKQ